MSAFERGAPASAILIRLMVGSVFLAEGVQKFLYPAIVGAGRFERIGIPAPEVLGPRRRRHRGGLRYGVRGFAHESRTDFAMIMGSLFLLAANPGPLPMDARRRR